MVERESRKVGERKDEVGSKKEEGGEYGLQSTGKMGGYLPTKRCIVLGSGDSKSMGLPLAGSAVVFLLLMLIGVEARLQNR